MRTERAREDVPSAESTSHGNFSEVHPGADHAKYCHEYDPVAAVRAKECWSFYGLHRSGTADIFVS